MTEKAYVKALSIFYCGSEACAPGHAFGPAMRTQYLLHYVVSGKGMYEVGSKQFAVGAGQGFLIKPGELTYYQADWQDPWTYMWVAFDGYEATELLDACEIAYFFQVRDTEKFSVPMGMLTEIFGQPEHNDYEYLALFYSMMSQLVRPRTQVQGRFETEYFEKAVAYVRNNFSYAITIGDLAKYVGIERSYLYKIFMAQHGSSPKRFLVNTRLTAAKNMMREKDFSLTEIALSCGFKDASALCVAFKKRTGKTTKQFRQELGRYQ